MGFKLTFSLTSVRRALHHLRDKESRVFLARLKSEGKEKGVN